MRYTPQLTKTGVLALAPQKKKKSHRDQTILQLCQRGVPNYEAQKGIQALAPQKSIIAS